jgi:hypothetical protein
MMRGITGNNKRFKEDSLQRKLGGRCDCKGPARRKAGVRVLLDNKKPLSCARRRTVGSTSTTILKTSSLRWGLILAIKSFFITVHEEYEVYELIFKNFVSFVIFVVNYFSFATLSEIFVNADIVVRVIPV